MEKTLILTPSEIQTLEWMARLIESRIEELQKENNKSRQIMLDTNRKNVKSILNKLT